MNKSCKDKFLNIPFEYKDEPSELMKDQESYTNNKLQPGNIFVHKLKYQGIPFKTM